MAKKTKKTAKSKVKSVRESTAHQIKRGKSTRALTAHRDTLAQINQQMFEGTIRVLGEQNMSLHAQVAELSAQIAVLRKSLAQANKMDREFQVAMAAEKSARLDQIDK